MCSLACDCPSRGCNVGAELFKRLASNVLVNVFDYFWPSHTYLASNEGDSERYLAYLDGFPGRRRSLGCDGGGARSKVGSISVPGRSQTAPSSTSHRPNNDPEAILTRPQVEPRVTPDRRQLGPTWILHTQTGSNPNRPQTDPKQIPRLDPKIDPRPIPHLGPRPTPTRSQNDMSNRHESDPRVDPKSTPDRPQIHTGSPPDPHLGPDPTSREAVAASCWKRRVGRPRGSSP